MAHGLVETEVNVVSQSSDETTIMYVLIVGAILLTFLVILGLLRLCCHKNTDLIRTAYPVAISNRMFNDSELGKDFPCLHCQLIEMGEMACYQEFCPHCGRVPPSRKTQEDMILEAHGYSRRIDVNRKQEINKEPPLLKKLNDEN